MVSKVDRLRASPNRLIQRLQSSTDSFQGTTGATVTSPSVSKSSQSKSKSKAGAVAGGVVGGLILLGLVAAAVLFVMQRNQQPAHADHTMFDKNESSESAVISMDTMYENDPTYEQASTPPPVYEQASTPDSQYAFPPASQV